MRNGPQIKPTTRRLRRAQHDAASDRQMHRTNKRESKQIEEISNSVTWLSLPHKSQLIILALCRLSEPLSNTCLLPYLYHLVQSLQPPGSSSSWISRQAGFLVALFALSQFFTSLLWGYLADRWGRKPIILFGLILSIISNVGFGFSRTIPGVMCWRVLAGIGNGNIGVMRTMTAEIVKEKRYQSRAFLMLPLVFNSGNVIGLAVGGLLAVPVVNIPWLFGPEGALNIVRDPQGVAWMRSFPYALPTLFNATVLSFTFLFAFCNLKETMSDGSLWHDCRRALNAIRSGQRRHNYLPLDNTDANEISFEATGEVSTKTFHRSSYREVLTREVLCMLLSFALLPLHNAAFMQGFPVFLSTPVPSQPPTPGHIVGGLGLSSSTTGLFLSAFGIFGVLIQLFIYPTLQGWLGTLWSYRLAMALFPIAYALMPQISRIPASNSWFQWIGIASILLLQVTGRTFGIPSSVILLTNSAPKPSALGRVHGIGNMVNSLSRAIGPAVAGVLFALGMEKGVAGLVWWIYLAPVAIISLLWSWTLNEGDRVNDVEKDVIQSGC